MPIFCAIYADILADIHVFKPISIIADTDADTYIQFADTDISVSVSAIYIG
jgi:hypothetical protein